jgi:hypothetical protein
MKKNVRNGAALLLAALAALVMAGCPQEAEPLSSDATLSSITIAGVTADSIGTPSEDWSTAVPGFVGLSTDKLASATVAVGAAEGAKVFFAAGKFGQIPEFVTNSTFSFDYGDCLYIEVFSANLDKCNIYQIEIGGSTAALTAITVNGKTATLGTPNVNAEAVETGAVYLSKSQLASPQVTVTKSDTDLKVVYGIAPSGVIPSFSESVPTSFNAEYILFVGVSLSPVSNVYKYYAVALHNTTPEIADITLGGRSATGGTQLNGIPIQAYGSGVGTPGSTWNDASIVEGEVWFGSSQANSNLPLVVTPVVADTVTVAVANVGVEPTGFANSPNITVINGSYLYIKAENTYPSDNGGTTVETAYYKIKLAQKSDSKGINGVTIGGKPVVVGQMGTHSFPGSESYGSYTNGAELAANNGGIASEVSLDSLQISLTGPTNGSIGYGYTPGDNERNYLIDFSNTSGILTNVPNGAFIALEVTSELGEKGWYKFRIYRGSIIATLSNLELGATDITSKVVPWLGTTPAVIVNGLSNLGTVTGTKTDNRASVDYGLGPLNAQNVPTGGWKTSGELFTATVPEGQTVYVRVTAEESSFTNTYSFALYTAAGVKATQAQIGGTSAVDTKGNVTVTMNGPTVTELNDIADSPAAIINGGVVELMDFVAAGVQSQTGNVVYVQSTVGTGLNYRVAKTSGAPPAEADWKPVEGSNPPAIAGPIANNDVLWIEVKGDTVTKYQKIVVTVKTSSAADAEIATLNVGGSIDAKGNYTGGTAVTSLGTPAATAGAVTAGSVTLTSTAAGAATVNAALTLVQPAYASYTFAKTAGTEPTIWQSLGQETNPSFEGPIVNGEALWFKVTLKDFVNIYKIVVTVQ